VKEKIGEFLGDKVNEFEAVHREYRSLIIS